MSAHKRKYEKLGSELNQQSVPSTKKTSCISLPIEDAFRTAIKIFKSKFHKWKQNQFSCNEKYSGFTPVFS